MNQGKPKIFYGWWIVLAGFVTHVFSSMTYGYGKSVFYTVLIDHFGWSRTQLAAAISLSRLETGVLGGVEGFLVDKFGPRPLMVMGAVVMGVGFIMLSRINSLMDYYLVFIFLIVIGQAFRGNIPLDTAVATWFIRRRGTAFGLIRAAVAIGATGVIIVAWFITEYGWRAAFASIGIGTIILGVPAGLVMRRRPEFYGLRPDGDPIEGTDSNSNDGTATNDGASNRHSSVANTDEGDIGMTVRQALSSWPFWTITAAFALRAGTTSAISLHAIPIVEDMGYSRTLAASVLGSIGLVSLFGRVGGGILNDRFGTKRVTLVFMSTLSVSFLILTQAHTIGLVWVFVAIYAPSYGALASTLPAIKGEYFGRRSFGAILGLSGMGHTILSMLFPVFAAWVYDTSGSYNMSFIVFTVTMLVATAMVMTLGPPRYRG